MSIIEVCFVLGIAATIAAGAIPGMTTVLDELRAAAAARHVAGRLQELRWRAVSRGRDTALGFTYRDGRWVVTGYEDGNRNGVLTRDIQAGLDPAVSWPERLADQFPGADFGAIAALPGAEGSVAPGADPVRLGAADRVTFTPAGTATPGSLYIRRGSAQYVVRILGETGRTRILKFHHGTRRWQPL